MLIKIPSLILAGIVIVVLLVAILVGIFIAAARTRSRQLEDQIPAKDPNIPEA